MKKLRLPLIGAFLVTLALTACALLPSNEAQIGSELSSGPSQVTNTPIQPVDPTETAPTMPPPTMPPLETLPPVDANPSSATEPPAAAGQQIFSLRQPDTQARFTLYEELRGQPKDVVGSTDQVTGQVALDLADLSAAQIGPVQVNARSLVTDSENRNRMMRNFILNTDTYEWITFNPTQVSGLSGSAAPGQAVTFQVAGDLTIRDITQPVTFEVNAQLGDDGLVRGSATTTVERSDYNLAIPSVPGVANVGQTVTLTIDFVLAPAA